jgi:uncharacterized cofD-like protein
MIGISNSFEEAVKRMSEVLAVSGKVLPVTVEDVRLVAELENGTVIKGESQIPIVQQKENSRIKRIYLEPSPAAPFEEVLVDILNAEAIVLGPGSLYTSVIPNLLVDGICDAIETSKAIKIYVCNIMTQPGETLGYTATDHIKALFDHGLKSLDYVIVNKGEIPEEYKKRYIKDMSEPVRYDKEEIEKMGIKVVEEDLVALKKEYIRHDEQKLAEVIIGLIN